MTNEKNWFLYIIKTKNNKLYTGITTDVERRFEEHKSGKKGAKFFRGNTPVKIMYTEVCKNRSEASKREAHIKSLTRPQKDALIKESKNE
ncbi:GIY-YIG catalytic domain protein [Bacteriovorax sp. BSW11_IV]|uniref:GIY-YIG nuclease family protein n=1 Tax=Bacteriovorax sp. BSW11_IV TaxID=1353529 RepID=UPI00038A52FD|nr:GIY-YIG nuclease family protein [Bacteriovorax sp. BSW11_IV]EQC43017.1 GIY-YIG catalytic domain protein [Bacteriovorax sp. BSW11_IV]